MSSLSSLVAGLKRQVAVPGEFVSSFPKTADTDLLGVLGDAFGQAQMDGFFGAQILDVNAHTITPDLSTAGSAVVGLYAAEGMLLSKFRNMPTKSLYKAGSVEYEVDMSANVLAAEIKDLQDRRKTLITQALRLARASTPSLYVKDAYLTRSMAFLPWFGEGFDRENFGFWAYELTGPW
jgi:hypothetical protein